MSANVVPVGIANIPSWGERETANANLIAAAPEMYKALKGCDEFFSEFMQVSEQALGNWGERWELVKAALAKADGGAH